MESIKKITNKKLLLIFLCLLILNLILAAMYLSGDKGFKIGKKTPPYSIKWKNDELSNCLHTLNLEKYQVKLNSITTRVNKTASSNASLNLPSVTQSKNYQSLLIIITLPRTYNEKTSKNLDKIIYNNLLAALLVHYDKTDVTKVNCLSTKYNALKDSGESLPFEINHK